jgi:hypothetical protein
VNAPIRLAFVVAIAEKDGNSFFIEGAEYPL